MAAEHRPLGQGHMTDGIAVAANVGGAATATPAVAPLDTTAGPSSPQGVSGPLHGVARSSMATPASTGSRTITRTEIINRATRWVNAKVPYSMSKYWSDGYRQDCSGFISMAWGLGTNQWTGSLANFGVRISKNELQPGDMLLFHNPADPGKGSHVTIFGGWADNTRQRYIAYEQAPPKTRKQVTPYAYWNNSNRYIPYRYKGVRDGGGSVPTKPDPTGGTAFPGASAFGTGANNKHVTKLGQMLVERGGSRYYRTGPGPRWSDADRAATKAFQQAQGWTGSAADGIPGPMTWEYLVKGKGRNIAGTGGGSIPGNPPVTPGTPPSAQTFPGAAHFRPGQSNPHIELLGKQLTRKGFGKYYTQGPGPRWSESDRRNVEAFQRAQGWRGSAADGYPGPETWRRLFS